jgi:acetyl esterase
MERLQREHREPATIGRNLTTITSGDRIMPLDPKAREMLDAMAALNLPPLQEMSVAAARESAIARLAQFPVPIKPVGSIVDRTIPGPGGELALRIYTPAGSGPFPLLMYFHGGGWVLCNLDTHDALSRDLCQGSGCIVVSVDYRLAPEHKFPAAVDDSVAATRWTVSHANSLNADAGRVAVSGDSAGGNLAAVTALRLRDESGPRLLAQLLVYPITAYHTPPTPSYIANADGYFLTRSGMIWFWDHYLRSAADALNPWAAPLAARDHSRLPPALVITAEYDPLRDEGRLYAEKLRAAGVATKLTDYAGMVHGFFGSVNYAQGAQAMADACLWLRQALR